MAVAETLRGMSLGDMMEEEREEVVDVAVVEGEGETAVEVAAAGEAAASATKAEVDVTLKTEAEAETEEEWHEAAEPELVLQTRVWARGRARGLGGAVVRGAGGRAVTEQPHSARPALVATCRERGDPHRARLPTAAAAAAAAAELMAEK